METMLSPEEQRALMAMNWADWPEEAATAATPPSKAAMRCCQIDQLEGGYLLENVDGRVPDTGVDVSELLEAKAGISGWKTLGGGTDGRREQSH